MCFSLNLGRCTANGLKNINNRLNFGDAKVCVFNINMVIVYFYVYCKVIYLFDCCGVDIYDFTEMNHSLTFCIFCFVVRLLLFHDILF
jgi:hypothetical protein